LLSNFLKITNSFGERSNPNTYGGKHGKWAIQADQYDNAVSDHTFLTTEAKVTPLITQQGLMDPGYMHISFIATLLDFKR